MGKHINQFLDQLRLKVANIESGLNGLKGKIDRKAEHAEKDVRDHLEAVKKHIAQGRTKVTAAQSEVKNWVDEEKVATSAKIAEWKAKRETAKLQNRADKAERYAAAASDVAVAALDEAEQAAVEAWLARLDANTK